MSGTASESMSTTWTVLGRGGPGGLRRREFRAAQLGLEGVVVGEARNSRAHLPSLGLSSQQGEKFAAQARSPGLNPLSKHPRLRNPSAEQHHRRLRRGRSNRCLKIVQHPERVGVRLPNAEETNDAPVRVPGKLRRQGKNPPFRRLHAGPMATEFALQERGSIATGSRFFVFFSAPRLAGVDSPMASRKNIVSAKAIWGRQERLGCRVHPGIIGRGPRPSPGVSPTVYQWAIGVPVTSVEFLRASLPLGRTRRLSAGVGRSCSTNPTRHQYHVPATKWKWHRGQGATGAVRLVARARWAGPGPRRSSSDRGPSSRRLPPNSVTSALENNLGVGWTKNRGFSNIKSRWTKQMQTTSPASNAKTRATSFRQDSPLGPHTALRPRPRDGPPR